MAGSEFTITGSSSFSGIVLDEEDQDKVEGLEEEIQSVDEQIQNLQKLKRNLEQEKKAIYQAASANTSRSNENGAGKVKPNNKTGTDYTLQDFPWSDQIKQTASSVFNIPSFRFCQEAVINSALDARHSVVIMPTGAGKSLCYQLPAILSAGLTLVISPLIALMNDQLLHLRENNIECEILASSSGKEESGDVLRRLKILGTGGGKSGAAEEVKVLFVTPERVAKSKTLISILQKIYDRDHLSRIVIDEAHCVSSLGHDFRPDYKKLSLLRNLMPSTPLMLLTATCSPSVLQDMLKILSLPATTSSTNASPNRTVYFTAPLDRPNLIYKIIPRSSSAKDSVKQISSWILENHPNDSGIIYCLSRKDTQTMSDSLKEVSNGRLKTGVYHAEVPDAQKHQTHLNWRNGKTKIVCATIAFGLGIDKGDVRFVIHSCPSKSLDGFYQETGRAGRDGKTSDCVLYYRATDSTRLSGMIAGENTGEEKLKQMLNYCQSSECRKVLFNRYFEENTNTSSSSTEKVCGRCDNCTSSHDESSLTDISLLTWKLVKITSGIYDNYGRITLPALADLARGNGGGKYNVTPESGGGKRKRDITGKSGVVDLDSVGGKVLESKDNVERAIVAAHIAGYLMNDYQATAYNVNTYISPGSKAIRMTRLDLEGAQGLKGLVMLKMSGNAKDKGKGKATKAEKEGDKKGKSEKEKKKGKGTSRNVGPDFDSELDDDLETEEEDESQECADDIEEDEEAVIAISRKISNSKSKSFQPEPPQPPPSKKKSKLLIPDDYLSKYNLERDDENRRERNGGYGDGFEDEDDEDDWQVMGGRNDSTSTSKDFKNSSKRSEMGEETMPIEIDSD